MRMSLTSVPCHEQTGHWPRSTRSPSLLSHKQYMPATFRRTGGHITH